MSLMLSEIRKNADAFVKEHSPEILTGIGLAGMLWTTVDAVGSTPRAMRLIEDRKQKERTKKLTAIQVIQTTWKCYVRPAVIGVLSAACIVQANKTHLRRQAALITAYSLSERALTDYSQKVKEIVGGKKESDIRDEVAKEQVARNPVDDVKIVQFTSGNTLCYDVASGRYFKSEIETLKKAANEINYRMMSEMYISLNEFYEEIGLPKIEVGDDLGWDVNKGLLELSFSACIAQNGEPCIVMNYDVSPEYFKRYMY